MVAELPDSGDALVFSEGLAAVQMSLQWGLVNKRGAVVVGPRFAEASLSHDRLAVVLPTRGVGGDRVYTYTAGRVVLSSLVAIGRPAPRYLNVFVRFSQVAAGEPPVDLGWHGTSHNVSSHVARFPVMGPFVEVFVYNQAPVKREVSVWG